MAGQTFAAATDLFKRVYFPGITDQLNNTTPGLGILKKTGRSAWSGSAVYMANRVGRNRSYRPTQSANESAAFPTAGRQTFDNFTVNCVILHGTGGVTAFGSAASQGPESAWAEMLKAEIQGHLADVRKDLEIDFYGTPLGVLAQVNGNPGAGASVTVTLDQDPQQLTHWLGNGNRYFSPNQRVDFLEIDGSATNGSNIPIQSVATANRTQIVVGDADDPLPAGVGDNNLIVRSGTFGTAAVGAGAEAGFAFNGLEMLFDDTTALPAQAGALGYELDLLQGVDRGTETYAHARVLDLNGAVLTRTTLNQAIRLMWEQSGLYPDLLLCHGSVQLQIADLMVGDQRYQPQKFPGGFEAKALVWNAGDGDIPIVPTRECPYDRIYAINLDCIEEFVLQDTELVETDGSILRQDSGGGDVWVYNWRKFCNIGSRQPNGAVKITRVGVDEAYGSGAARPYDF